MKNENLIIGGVVIVLVVILFAGFGGMMGYGSTWMGSMMYNYFSGMWLFGIIYRILVLVALVLFIIWLVKRLQK